MSGKYWTEVKKFLELLAPFVTKADKDGIDL